ncbi:MAG TPA: SDR family NAD(P)-dependent oxidoreductase, partial [Verrucomicrobiae bacterium]|nr:SDR family NAD(P)-dependent oxidoreductase [Verrucomicrobiae bacterium]
MTQSPSAPLLAGKRIVVIGGTGGIGLSAVKAFIATGACVVAVGLERDEMKHVARDSAEVV